MAQQAITAQRDPERDQGIHLRGLALQQELRREGQHQHGEQSGLRIPQAPAQVAHQPQGADRGQRAGQQERQLQVAQQPVEQGAEPEEHRRLVRVVLAAPGGKQPLAALHHLTGDLGEAGLVGRPGVAQADAGQQHDGRGRQPEQRLAAHGGVRRHGCCAPSSLQRHPSQAAAEPAPPGRWLRPLEGVTPQAARGGLSMLPAAA